MESTMLKLLTSVAVGVMAAAGPAEAGPYSEENQDTRAIFTVGTVTAPRGQTARGAIKVPDGSDAGYDIPVAVVHGARPGPVLAIVAGSHGTEYASIVAVTRLIAAVDAAQLSGTLILVPLVNVASFERIVPHLNPVDNKNMNRFYPGNPGGTQTERASHAITREVIEKCDHLIDLHGGDIDESLRPYSYWTVTGNQAQDARSRELVLAFGLDHIIISADRPKDPNASRFLENTASTRGKPSFTAEAGHAGTVDTDDVDVLVNGSLNVMRALKMLAGAVKPVESPVWIDRTVTVAADTGGMFVPAVKRGTYVEKGTKVGDVTDFLGKVIAEARSPEAGIVTFVRAVPSLQKGDTIAAVGIVKR
jgi:predicted deacylase